MSSHDPARSCFDNHYVLHLDDRAIAEFRGRWFSHSIDIRRAGAARYRFEHRGIINSRFSLTTPGGETLATATGNAFTTRWALFFGEGRDDLVMVSDGWLSQGFHAVDQSGRRVAPASAGGCSLGWTVATEAGADLSEVELLVIGLVYHTILVRRRQAAAAAS